MAEGTSQSSGEHGGRIFLFQHTPHFNPGDFSNPALPTEPLVPQSLPAPLPESPATLTPSAPVDSTDTFLTDLPVIPGLRRMPVMGTLLTVYHGVQLVKSAWERTQLLSSQAWRDIVAFSQQTPYFRTGLQAIAHQQQAGNLEEVRRLIETLSARYAKRNGTPAVRHFFALWREAYGYGTPATHADKEAATALLSLVEDTLPRDQNVTPESIEALKHRIREAFLSFFAYFILQRQMGIPQTIAFTLMGLTPYGHLPNTKPAPPATHTPQATTQSQPPPSQSLGYITDDQGKARHAQSERVTPEDVQTIRHLFDNFRAGDSRHVMLSNGDSLSIEWNPNRVVIELHSTQGNALYRWGTKKEAPRLLRFDGKASISTSGFFFIGNKFYPYTAPLFQLSVTHRPHYHKPYQFSFSTKPADLQIAENYIHNPSAVSIDNIARAREQLAGLATLVAPGSIAVTLALKPSPQPDLIFSRDSGGLRLHRVNEVLPVLINRNGIDHEVPLNTATPLQTNDRIYLFTQPRKLLMSIPAGSSDIKAMGTIPGSEPTRAISPEDRRARDIRRVYREEIARGMPEDARDWTDRLEGVSTGRWNRAKRPREDTALPEWRWPDEEKKRSP